MFNYSPLFVSSSQRHIFLACTDKQADFKNTHTIFLSLEQDYILLPQLDEVGGGGCSFFSLSFSFQSTVLVRKGPLLTLTQWLKCQNYIIDQWAYAGGCIPTSPWVEYAPDWCTVYYRKLIRYISWIYRLFTTVYNNKYWIFNAIFLSHLYLQLFMWNLYFTFLPEITALYSVFLPLHVIPTTAPLMKFKKIMTDAQLSFFNKLHSGNLNLKLSRPSPILI